MKAINFDDDKAGLETKSIQSLDRGLSILEAIAKSDQPVSLGSVTELLGIDRSSACRLAQTLTTRGFLSHPPGRKDYIAGPASWQLFRRHKWRKLNASCSEHLKGLARESGETAHLAVLAGRRALFIGHQASTTQLVAVSGQTGAFVPLHCTAHGKALLADYKLPALEALFGDLPLERFTETTITTLPGLAVACAKIGANGLAIDDEEHTPEVRCVAAPVRNSQGIVVASIGISAPASHRSGEGVLGYAEIVARIARHATDTVRRLSAPGLTDPN